MSVAGTYAIVVKTPIGEQRGNLAIRPDGAGFTGSLSGDLGSLDISGKVSANTARWAMEVLQPMALKLDCSATIDGDTLTGTVKAGFLGTYPMTGVRIG